MSMNFDNFMRSIAARRQPVNLISGFGVHRLTLNLSTKELGEEAPPVQFSGELWAENLGNCGWIGPLTQPRPVNARWGGDNLELHTVVTDEQLRRLERARAGADLSFRVDIIGTRLGETSDWPVAQCQLTIYVAHAEWSKALEQLGSSAYVDVLVPLTDLEGRALAARRLREAKVLIRNGDFEGAVGKARSVLDAVRPACNTAVLYSEATKKKAADRTQEERWAVLTQSAYALFSGAPHDDEGTTEHFTWTRADAVAAVATSAGLLARLEDLP